MDLPFISLVNGVPILLLYVTLFKSISRAYIATKKDTPSWPKGALRLLRQWLLWARNDNGYAALTLATKAHDQFTIFIFVMCLVGFPQDLLTAIQLTRKVCYSGVIEHDVKHFLNIPSIQLLKARLPQSMLGGFYIYITTKLLI